MTDKAKEPIKVVDRRHFTSEGDPKPEFSEDARPERPSPATPAEPAHNPKPEGGDPDEELSPFGEFVISLASSCLMSLGQIPDVPGGRGEPDLDAAGPILDVLEMLREKTAGNLNPQESALLEQTLFQLKMTYLRVRKGDPS